MTQSRKIINGKALNFLLKKNFITADEKAFNKFQLDEEKEYFSKEKTREENIYLSPHFKQNKLQAEKQYMDSMKGPRKEINQNVYAEEFDKKRGIRKRSMVGIPDTFYQYEDKKL